MLINAGPPAFPVAPHSFSGTENLKLDLSAPPPSAKPHTKKLEAHGHVRTDPFHWMRRARNTRLKDYLQAENTYAEAAMAPLKTLRDQIYTEMLGRIQETDLSVPVRFGDWIYFSRTHSGSQYAIHLRQRISRGKNQEAAEEVLLDENIEAAGHAFYEIGDYEVSPSGRYLAWTEDIHGDRSYRLKVRDLRSGRNLRLCRSGVISLSWAEDELDSGLTLFFVTEDRQTHRACQLWRQHLSEKQPTLIYTERDERFSIYVGKTRSRAFLVLNSTSHTTSETRILPAQYPDKRWRIVLKRRAGIEYEIDHHSSRLFMRIDDTGDNFRLVSMPVDNWEPECWHEEIAHRDDTVLEDVDLYQDWLITTERTNGVPRLMVTHLNDGQTHAITFSDPTYVVELDDLPEWNSQTLRYIYESLTTPESVFDYDPLTQTSVLLRRQPVLGKFDPSDYVSERIEALASDGAKVPISLVYRRDTTPGPLTPAWLEGYGAYGVINDPWFSVTRLSLLDRGWVFAIAHVRGGGELGQAWHEAGKLHRKSNSFDDFLACAHALVTEHYTGSGRILANGGSAGGLLVAAALNKDSGIFGAAILEVPFVDVVTTMQDPSLPLTVGEFEEWGNPAKRSDYFHMLSWSPYDNVDDHSYPPMLIEAGLNDSQVMVWESAKYVAKHRLLRNDTAPLIFFTNMETGHGGASGRYDALEERARQIAFALSVLQPCPKDLPQLTVPDSH